MTAMLWGAIALTFVVSLALPVVVKPLLVKLGIMDVPTERSSHIKPVLRGLGLAVLLAMAVGFAVSWAIPQGASGHEFAVIVACSLASGLLGLGEDLHGVSVPVRSALLLIIATASAVVLVHPTLFLPAGSFGWGPAFDRSTLPLWVLALLIVYAVLFISSYINVANFMDGLNGISGFHGVIAGVTFAVLGLISEMPWLALSGGVLAAAFAGFLPWNLTKPGAFLGDVGSYLLGGSIAVMSFAALMSGVGMLATIGPMVIYFGDVGVTLVRRVRAGHAWDEPHKEHTYQRIQQLGYSHVSASAMTAFASVCTAVLGVCSLATDMWGTLALFAGGVLVLVVYLLAPKILPKQG